MQGETAPPAGAAPPAESAASGSAGPGLDLTLSTRDAGPDIPWDRLRPDDYREVRDVVGGAFAVREVQNIVFRSRPAVYEFLLDHPEFAAEVARALRRGKYQLRRSGEVYELEDGPFARGRVRQLLAEGGRRVFLMEGRYEPPLVPLLAGRIVLVLDSEHVEGSDGQIYCQIAVAGHVRFDTELTAWVARVSRSLSETRVEGKVRSFFKHAAVVSRRAYDDPEGLAELMASQPGLNSHTLAAFREVLTRHLPPVWARHKTFGLLETGALAATVFVTSSDQASTALVEPSGAVVPSHDTVEPPGEVVPSHDAADEEARGPRPAPE